jgi:thiamine biosynthesis lipoprotein
VEPARLSVPLSNQAIATSGDYATDEWGNGFFHIIHPKTCRPLQKKQGSISATTVIAPTCALADAIATTLMLFETKEEAENWAQQIPEVKFWIFTR